jgi:biotin transport system substrate-specific component
MMAYMLQMLARRDKLAVNFVLVNLGALTMVLLSRVSFSQPIPFTLQSMGVLLLAVFLGPRMAAIAILEYLILGAAGLPVFARGGGIAYLLGPTAGYLFSMPLAALVAGFLFKQIKSKYKSSRFIAGWFASVVSCCIILLFGWAWLTSTYPDKDQALIIGFVQFLPIEILKSMVVAIVFIKKGE